MEVNTYDYELNGKKYHFKFTARASIMFEKLRGNLDESQKAGIEESYMFAYAGTFYGMKDKGLEFDITYEQFLDLIDVGISDINQLMDVIGEKKNMMQRERP